MNCAKTFSLSSDTQCNLAVVDFDQTQKFNDILKIHEKCVILKELKSVSARKMGYPIA